jgi:DNA-binding transcriptional ArsR family regulator
LSETTHISDTRTAAVFARPRQRHIVLCLIDDERSLSQLAAHTGLRLSLLHHHVQKLVDLGLVRVSRVQSRNGRAVKYYRASARTFFVPSELADLHVDGRLPSQLRDSLERSRMRTFQGVLYSWEAGGPSVRFMHDPASQLSASEIWLELRLSQAEAAALTEQLTALFSPFHGRPPDAGSRYIIHAAVALGDQ